MPSTMTLARSSLVSSGLVPGSVWAGSGRVSDNTAAAARNHRSDVMTHPPLVETEMSTEYQ